MTTCTKRPYFTKRAAQGVINARMSGQQHLKSRRQKNASLRRRPEFLRAYHCPDCGAWHLTHSR